MTIDEVRRLVRNSPAAPWLDGIPAGGEELAQAAPEIVELLEQALARVAQVQKVTRGQLIKYERALESAEARLDELEEALR